MRQYIIALTIELPDNVPPQRWLGAKIGSVELERITTHIEEINVEKATKTNDDSGNSGNKSRVEASSKGSAKTSGNTKS